MSRSEFVKGSAFAGEVLIWEAEEEGGSILLR